jgi:hypothetical protein
MLARDNCAARRDARRKNATWTRKEQETCPSTVARAQADGTVLAMSPRMNSLASKVTGEARAAGEVTSRRPHRRRNWRAALVTIVVLVAVAAGLRYAVRTVPWVGPAGADLLRRLIGSDAVTRLEEFSAVAEDRLHQARRGEQAPRSIAEVERRSRPISSTTAAPPSPVLRPRFTPRDIGPMQPRVAAAGDGVWRAVPDPNRPSAAALMFTTMLHPDARRPWSEVFVVSIDLPNVGVYAVPGRVEPKATTGEGRAAERPGLVPAHQRRELLAVFNGGFKTEHGQHNMFVDGVTLVPARKGLCTVVGFEDGSLRIGTWENVAEEVANPRVQVRFYRQAAPCMAEGGKLNSALRDENTRNWGATLEGGTVIRRSAIGLDAKRSVLFVAITNDTTATALARAMLHAGAADVAQLDVNWSYPKFVTFPREPDGVEYAQSLFEGFLVGRDDFVRKRSSRDFFYVVVQPERAAP